jgi:peptide-methionine (S)-S-oxide reductase
MRSAKDGTKTLRTIISAAALLLAGAAVAGGAEAMAGTERATLGGGCFWCLEAVYEEMDGVKSVVSGYAGGDDSGKPNYKEVCSGETGHAEVVQVTFDPEVVSYGVLLDVFFQIHDPTTKDRQGADVGTQYRSIILTHDDVQREAAAAEIAVQSKRWPNPIVTEVAPLEKFHAAEEYHQDYFKRNPSQAYCQMVVRPKVEKARKAFPDRLR